MSKETVKLLIEFKNKGGAWQSQSRATGLLRQLKPLLTETEYFDIHIAHEHYRLGESAAEFYDISNKLIEKYVRDPDNI